MQIVHIVYFILSLYREFTNMIIFILGRTTLADHLMISFVQWLHELIFMTFSASVCYIICMACVYNYYTYVCTNYLNTTNVLCIEPAAGWYMYLTWQLVVAWNVSWNEYYSKCLHFICPSYKYNFAQDSTFYNARVFSIIVCTISHDL